MCHICGEMKESVWWTNDKDYCLHCAAKFFKRRIGISVVIFIATLILCFGNLPRQADIPALLFPFVGAYLMWSLYISWYMGGKIWHHIGSVLEALPGGEWLLFPFRASIIGIISPLGHSIYTLISYLKVINAAAANG